MNADNIGVKVAYSHGQLAYGEHDAENPHDADVRPDLYDAWEAGYEYAEDMASDSYACSFDSSMRDTHGVPGRDL